MKKDIVVKYHGFKFLTDEWMGSRMLVNKYEVEEVKLIDYIPNIETLSVLELGGCLGVVSVVLNSKLNNPSKHVVVEANPKLIRYLEHNREVNNCSYNILNGLLTPNSNNNIFYSYDKLVAGSAHRLDDSKETNKTEHIVDTFTISEIESKYKTEFNLLVMDIEGGELEFLNEFPTLNFKYILVELHQFIMPGIPNFNNKCLAKFKDRGYTRMQALGNSFLLKKEAN